MTCNLTHHVRVLSGQPTDTLVGIRNGLVEASTAGILSFRRVATFHLLSHLQGHMFVIYNFVTLVTKVLFSLPIDNILPMDWKHITCPIYFNGCRLSLSAFRAYKVQMYFGVLRWRSSGPPTQLIVFTNSAETKPFTQLNSRYSVNSSGSW